MLEMTKTKRRSRYTSGTAVFLERFIRTMRNLLKSVVCFLKKNSLLGWWKKSIINNYKNTKISSIRTTPTQESLTKTENKSPTAYWKEERSKPKFRRDDSVRTAENRNIFSEATKQSGALKNVQLFRLRMILFQVVG